MVKIDEKQLPTDIPTLQSMVKKRDSIIAELRMVPTIAVGDTLQTELEKEHEALKADYESCCVQLKARDGDNSRLHEELGIYKRDYEQLKKLYDANVQQLDQESDSNAKLEDQLANTPPGWSATISEEYEKKITFLEDDLEAAKKMAEGAFIDKNEEIKLLQEKLVLCDKFYKADHKKLEEIAKILKIRLVIKVDDI